MKPYIPENLPLTNIRWEDHIPLIGKANAALARYDGILQSIVNPAVLLSPLTTQEAVLSSKIEGTQASLEEVLEFQADPSEKIAPEKAADIHEIINYRTAMFFAMEDLKNRPLCLNLVRDLHRILLESVRGKNKDPGEFRRVQNFIGPLGTTIEQATFVPPSPEKILPAMSNWEKYVHFEEKDGLIQLAIIKAQFELIHPFLDGNGRIGRILVPIFLYHKGLLSSPMFYLSFYLERNRPTYFERLNAISRDGDWNGWIGFFLKAVMEQAQENGKKAKAILDLYNHMKQLVPEITRSQYAVKVIDSMFSQPIFLSTDFMKVSNIPRDSALRMLSALKEAKVINSLREAKGRRASLWVFPELLRITED
ncbi:MAG: Fic/DOC family N-terminal domain-containing protein [Syntrophobacteraceae bacterium]|jgi:Fic family protein